MKKWVCLLGAFLAVHLALLVLVLLLGGGAFETGAVGGSHGKKTEEKTADVSGRGDEKQEDSAGTEDGSRTGAEAEAPTGSVTGEVTAEGSDTDGSVETAGTVEERTTGPATDAASTTEPATVTGPATDEASTTELATTTGPATDAPTAAEPTATAAPTTEPATVAPTTAEAITTAPTTAALTTTEAATTAPTTAAPTADIFDGTGLYQVLTMTEQEALARGKVIYLTFDDGPGPYTPKLLEILNKYNVKVTFFVTGGYPEWYHMMKEAKEDGPPSELTPTSTIMRIFIPTRTIISRI